MNFKELKKEYSIFFPIIRFESFFPYKIRNKIKNIAILLSFLFFFSIFLSQKMGFGYEKILEFCFFFSLLITSKLIAIDAYFYSFYFRDLSNTIKENNNEYPKGSFMLAEILLKTEENDLLNGLLCSKTGLDILNRLGIYKDEINQFLIDRKEILSLQNIKILDKNLLISYILNIYENSKDFKNFLFEKSILKEDLSKTISWVIEKDQAKKRKLRSWSKDNLSKNQPIGSDWSYGQIYKLEKYGHRIEEIFDVMNSELPNAFVKELDTLESSLEKREESNVILVGDDSALKTDLVIALKKKILNGNVLSKIKDKIMIVLDTNSIIDQTREKTIFENEIIDILNQAERAGDVILVIQDLPSFIMSSRSIGSDIMGIIDPYLSSSNSPIIAMSDNTNFHQIIETNLSIMERFEVVKINSENKNSIIEILFKKADYLENIYGVLFTYQAIKEVSKSSERFFIGQTERDKALDILEELPFAVAKKGRFIILKEDVEEMIEIKTGIPRGEIKDKEKEKILNLENKLREMIIGQDQAIKAISNAIRRSRSGVEAENRPIGSFLFLGPTGVGKTETTKALSKIFFDGENSIIRLDMSEFTGTDAINRLIGSFEGEKVGILSSKLRERPYSVLLLDEFEKANKDVHDLFLQIIDEGIFSDMLGKKVNARNTIIIATSNAGSEMIWDIENRGENVLDKKQDIINNIVDTNILRPELLNRFDEVIIFHPLNKNDLKEVSKLMLERLKDRLLEKGFELIINDELIEFIVEKGNDPKFGARPINRAIQDILEKVIAEKIIKGELKAGQKISFTKEDLEN